MQLKLKLFNKVFEFRVSNANHYLWQVCKLDRSGAVNETIVSGLAVYSGEARRRARSAAEHFLKAEGEPVQWAVFTFPEYRLVDGKNLWYEAKFELRSSKLKI